MFVAALVDRCGERPESIKEGDDVVAWRACVSIGAGIVVVWIRHDDVSIRRENKRKA
jgi:hypothetical protein